MAIYELEDRIYFDAGLPADIAEVDDTSEEDIENNSENTDTVDSDNSENVSIAPDSPSAETDDESDDSSDNSSNDSSSDLESTMSTTSTSSIESNDISALLDSIDDATLPYDIIVDHNFLIVSADNENLDEITDSLNNNTSLIIYDSNDTFDSIIQQLKDELGDNKAVNIGIINSDGDQLSVISNLLTNNQSLITNDQISDFLSDLKDLQYFDGEINLMDFSLDGHSITSSIINFTHHNLGEGGQQSEIINDADSLTDYFLEDSDFLTTDNQQQSTNNEIVFINSSVMNADEIVDDLSENAEVVYLTSGEDGIQEITDYLEGRSDIDTIRIISHGNEGYFVLNGEIINSDHLLENGALIASWSKHLSENADIMVYGCNLAASDEGKAFVDSFADLTGADVAASIDSTGISGNWDLEYVKGLIESNSLTIIGYGNNLTDYLVQNTDGETTVLNSLGWAIVAANSNVGADSITFDPSIDGQAITSNQEYTITESVTITGNGVENTIIQAAATSGTANHRVFKITTGTVILENMTIQNGKVSDKGGGIYNAGDLTLNTCTITGNTVAGSSTYQQYGGGIYNKETLKIYDSTISNNTVHNTVNDYNQAMSLGGGIASNGSLLTIKNSTISGNTASSEGHEYYGTPYSAISKGGGILVGSGTFTMNNSTVSGNTASATTEVGGNTEGFGGGLYIDADSTATISNSTISGNSITAASNNPGDGIFLAGTLTVRNTIIAQNSSNDDFYYGTGTLHDGGYNVVEYQSGSLLNNRAFNKTTDILYNTEIGTKDSETSDVVAHSAWNQNKTDIAGNLELSVTLENNGGPTLTLALGSGSFAAASATTGIPSANNWNNSPEIEGAYTDQRGVERTADQNTSIGAYSANYTPALYYMAKDVAGQGTYNWDATNVWYTNTIGGTNPNDYTTLTETAPDANNSIGIIIYNNIAMTIVTGGFSIDQTTVNTGASITVSGGQTLTIADGDEATDFTNNGTVTVNGILSLAGTVSGTAFAYGDSSTLEYSGATAQETSDVEFASSGIKNLTIANTEGVTLNGTKSISGDFTVADTYSLTTGAYTLTVDGATSVAGTITVSASGALDADGLLTLSGTVNNSGTIYAASSVSITPASVGGTFVYNGSNQTVEGLNYTNLTLAGSDTITISDETSVGTAFSVTEDYTSNTMTNSGTLTLSGTSSFGSITTISGGTVDYAGSGQTVAGITYTNLTLSGSGTVTVSDGTNVGTALSATGSYTSNTITNSGTLTLNGTSNFTSVTIISGGTVVYAGAGQTVAGLTYTNLTLAGSGTVTVSDGTTVNGALSITEDYTDNTITNSGTLTLSGTSGFGNITTISGGTVVYAGSGQTVAGLTYTNLTLAGSGTVTVSDGTTVNGALSVTEDYTDNTITNSGTLTLNGTSSFGSITTVSGGTVTYNGAAQDIADVIYNNLTTSGSGTKTISSSLSVSGLLTHSGSGDFDTNGNNITANGLTVFNGTFNTEGADGSWDINGDITLTGGTLTATSETILFAGTNWTLDGGTFTANDGTVNFDRGTAQNILTGDITFAGLTLAEISVIITSQTVTVSGVTSGNGTIDATDGTFTYNRSGDQSIFSGTYNAITLSGSGTKTFSGSEGDVKTTIATAGITVDSNITVSGGGVGYTYVQADASSSAGAANRVFTIESDKTVTISNMTVRYGKVTGSGGGIYTTGTGSLTLNNITVSDCIASVNGDGIYSDSALTVTNTVDLNSSLYHNTFGDLTFADTSSVLKLAAASNTIKESLFFNGGATVEYDGNIDQAIANLSYYNLTTSGYGTKTTASGLPTTISVDNTLTTGADGFTIGSGVTLEIGDESGSGVGIWTNSATVATAAGSTVSYIDTEDQTILNTSSDGVEYNVLRLSGSGSIKTFSGTTTVTGGVTVSNDMTVAGDGAETTIVQAHAEQGSAASRVFTIDSSIEVTISDMTIRNGNDVDGGGIFNKGVLTLSNCTVSGNTANGKGGGIYNYFKPGEDGGTIASISNSTISGNSAGGDGGGIFNNYLISSIYNSTISGNTSDGKGGGIYTGENAVSVAITDSTIANNHSDNDVETGSEKGGGIYLSGGTLTVSNTIIANNYIGNGTTGDDYYYSGGSLTDSGYNIVKIQDGSSNQFDNSADWIWNSSNSRYEKGGSSTTDYGLLYLDTALKANDTLNGTYTLSITSSDSIAVGNGSTTEKFDQRGYYRGLSVGITIGAYEYDAAAPSVGNYISIATGNWSDYETVWETYNSSSGEWETATVAPDSANSSLIIVSSGDTVTVTSDLTIDQTVISSGGTVITNITGGNERLTIAEGTGTDLTAYGSITVSLTDTLLISSGAAVDANGTFTVTGTLSFDDGGENNGTLNLGSSSAINILTAKSSTITYDGTDQDIAAVTYYNLSLTGGNDVIKSLTGTTTVSNNFTIAADTELAVTDKTLNLTGADSTADINGTLSISSGSVTVSGTSDIDGTLHITAAGSYDANGNFDAANGTITFDDAGNLYLYGTVTSLGSLSNDHGTVTYDGTAQNVADATYYDLSISGSGTKTLLGNLDEANRINTLTVDAASDTVVFDTDGYDVYAAVLNVASDGSITDSGGGGSTILDISTTSSIGGNITTLGTQTYTGAVTLTGNVSLSATDSNISFGNTVLADTGLNGRTLTIDSGTGNIDFTGAAGSNTNALMTLTITHAGNVYFNAVNTRSGGLIFTNEAAGTITLNGNISTDKDSDESGSVEIKGAVVLSDDIIINTGSNNTSGSIIISGTVNGTSDNTQSLTLNAGSDRTVSVTGAIGGTENKQLETLTVTNSAGAIFKTVSADTGVVLADTTGTIEFQGVLTTAALTTANKAYNVSLTGGLTITDAVNFLNTRTVTIGNDSIKTSTFTGGVSTTGNSSNPSSVSLAGNIATSNAAANFGTATITADTTIDTAGGVVSFGALTINNEKTLTVGTGNTGAISFNGAVDSASGGTGSLTINTDDTATLSENIGSDAALGTITLTAGSIDTGGKNIKAENLTVNGGTFNTGIEQSGTWNISGDVSIAAEATLAATSGNFYAGGNWTIAENGTFENNSGTVIFNGTSEQQITSSGNDFNNVTITNEGATVKLMDNATVSGTLELTNGKGLLDTNSNTLTVNGSIQDNTESGNNFDSNHMIIVNGTGKLQLSVSENISYLFPVGTYFELKGYEYSPITIGLSGGSFAEEAYIEVTAAPEKYEHNPCDTDYLSRYWNAASAGITGFSATVTCHYDQADVDGTESSIYGAEYLSGSWIKPTLVDAENKTFTITAVTSLAVFSGIAAPYTASVTINPSTSQTLAPGNTLQFSAAAYDQYENLITSTASDFTWANTTNTGLFNKTVSGTYTVNASYNSISSVNVSVTVNSPKPTRPDVNNGEMINDGTQTQTYSSWRTAIDNGASDSIDSNEGFEENETEGIGLIFNSLITFDASAESVANGEYSMSAGGSSGIISDGEYGINANSGLMINGEYGIDSRSSAGSAGEEFNSQFDGLVDLSFDFDTNDSLINYEAIALYSERHPLFESELDLLLKKI